MKLWKDLNDEEREGRECKLGNVGTVLAILLLAYAVFIRG